MKNYKVELGEDNLNEKFISCCFEFEYLLNYVFQCTVMHFLIPAVSLIAEIHLLLI